MRTVVIARWLSPLQAVLARYKWWGPHRLAAGERAIWALNGAMLVTASVLFWVGVRGTEPVVAGMHLPLWALILAFAAGERFVVHVHFRRSAHTLSLGEIPLVFGLIFASGQDVVVAGALGPMVVLALHRKLPPIKLAFNLGQFTLGNCVAVIVFHAVAGSVAVVGPLVWAAAALAVAANSIIASVLIMTAVSVTEGGLSLRRSLRALGTDVAVASAGTSVALCAATVVHHDWATALLMVIPAAAIFIMHRGYLGQRDRQQRLELLYDAARTLSSSAEIGPALEGLLARTLDDFRAETSQLILFSPSTQTALRTVVRADGSGQVLERVDPGTAEELRAVAEQVGPRACAISEIAQGKMADYANANHLSAGMFAALRGDNGLLGVFLVGDPSGISDTFTEDDLKPFETLVTNISVALQNDQLTSAVWQMRELHEELERKASHDPLTGLANRLVFGERVRAALDRGGELISVIFIDIDDFKMINDSLGHSVGDGLLVAVARRLEDCVRPTDLVARLGGDEFAVMLDRACSTDEAIEITERVIGRLGERFVIDGARVTTGASAGIATCGGQDMSPEELIRHADMAMYQAKRAGKNSYVVFHPGMEAPTLTQLRLERRLREGVDDSSFVVHYQPIHDLETGEVVAREALVRWLDGPNGPVQPRSFIPVAEETGLIVPIGKLVLNQACQDARRWHQGRAGAPAVHVNLSAVELRHPDFLQGVADALDRSGLDPERLVFEIAESALMQTPEASIEVLRQLRTLGPRVALDDFGLGYSSLTSLRRLPLDWLKLELPQLTKDGQEVDGQLVAMILSLAENLGCRVIGEGIESEGQLAELLGLGCRFGQGFFLGRPKELASAANTAAEQTAPLLSAGQPS
jgi:diguanylate cyclase (GGDEF)-like protein